MEVHILLEIQVKPENAEELKKALKEMLVDTRAFDGCIDIYAIQNQEDPSNIILFQRWQSRQHYEIYSAWRAETGVADAMSAKLSASFSIRYFDPVDA